MDSKGTDQYERRLSLALPAHTCLKDYFFVSRVVSHLTHLSLEFHTRDIGKKCRPRSDAAERGVWSGSTLFALRSEISTQHDNNKNDSDTPYIWNGPVQRVMVEQSTRFIWVKQNWAGAQHFLQDYNLPSKDSGPRGLSSLRCPPKDGLDPWLPTVPSEDPDHTVRMQRLVWV